MASTSYLATDVSIILTGAKSTFDAYLDNVSVSGVSADMVDVTKQGSTGDWREKMSALKDGGQVVLSVHYDPDSTTPPAVGDTAFDLTIVWGTTPNPDKSFKATCLVQNISVTANLGEKITSDITVEITGDADFANDITP